MTYEETHINTYSEGEISKYTRIGHLDNNIKYMNNTDRLIFRLLLILPLYEGEYVIFLALIRFLEYWLLRRALAVSARTNPDTGTVWSASALHNPQISRNPKLKFWFPDHTVPVEGSVPDLSVSISHHHRSSRQRDFYYLIFNKDSIIA